MSGRSAFPLIVLFLLSSPLFSVQGCPPREHKALLRFKSTVHDMVIPGMLSSWKGDDCCQWNGVQCNGTQERRHVSKLDLQDFGFNVMGIEIDSSLFELHHLSYLGLRGSYFRGEIPSQLGQLSSLHHLHIDFSSDISCGRYDMCVTSSNLSWLSNLSSLEYLSLRFVDVEDNNWGSIIGSLLHLKYLDLSRCSFPGPTFPNTLLNLSALTFLDLSDLSYFQRKNMSGSIPNDIGKLSSLIHLDFSGNIISGNIPNTIGNLTRLEYLDLSSDWTNMFDWPISSNGLSGQIPSSLGMLLNLTFLRLSYNQLSGSIPLSIGSLLALEELFLNNNQLQGNIPVSLGNLHKLRKLSLLDNQLSGSLPHTFAQLFYLTYLDVSNNHLSGSLPLSLGTLFSLTYLNMGSNLLNGSIPASLSLSPSLQELYLSNNYMNGTITEVLFWESLKLEVLDLSHSGLRINISSTWIPSFQLRTLLLKKCQIGGPVPSWISTQFSLVKLDLSATQLMGDLPSWLWDNDIEEIRLSDNHLQGSFTPTSGSFRYLDLSMNALSGRLTADILVHLSNAKVLKLADNKFEGQIPTTVVNLTNLLFLDMSNNFLTGNVAAILGNLTLRGLNLENNFLEGEIPKELGRLWYLSCLRIGKNSLQGILPSSLANFSDLRVFDVGGNNMTGNIPQWIANFSSLQVLVMRGNNFRGNLPPEIGQLPALQVLDLSSNFFSGAIPHPYFRLPAMQNGSAYGPFLGSARHSSSGYRDSIDLIVKGQERHYEYVLSRFVFFDLSNNRLNGPLPPDIENLKGLMYLNLSMNSLIGPIPESIGNLLQLESLDLSSNNFSGGIPWQVGNLTYLAVLNLSCNNLSGRIPQQGGQMLTFDESSYKGNPNLWGCPLKRNCHRPVARGSAPPAVTVEKREEGFETLWYWMCFGLGVGVGILGVVLVVLMLKLGWRVNCFEQMDRVIELMDKVICKLPKPMPVWR